MGKKGDPFHLGLLLSPEEGFFKINNVKETLHRLVLFYGGVTRDNDYYRLLFQDLMDNLCSSRHPNSMSGWSTASVFKWVFQKLFDFSYCLSAQSSTLLSKNNLFSVLKNELGFNFSTEMSTYLLSN